MINLENDKSQNAPLLESIGVAKVYEDYGNMIQAVSDVSLKIKSGEIITIYGPAGSGKSTLLRILSGVEKPDIGEVLIKGEPYYEFSSREQRFIRLQKYGIVTGNKSEMNHLQVIQNIMYPKLATGVNEKEAQLAAKVITEKLGLEKYLSKVVSRLDPFIYKITSLARSLINQPWIIFVDEPFSALNHNQSDLMTDILNKINVDFQVAIVIATNDPIYLSKSAKPYLMDGGRIVDFDAGENPVERLSKAIDNIKKKHGL
ncbi:MAG: ATP-binding cassette domain-containing protein [Chloroflexi bacterium]|nr:ATP-binding cassette domain-containing protein [Chloroflexota bacterium]